ncbi:MAG: hypothetical protein ABUL61_00545, partial [Oleiharenicola lentus]
MNRFTDPRMNSLSPARRTIAALGTAWLLLAGPGAARADFLEKFLHKDVDVITVTDVTEAGKGLTPATPSAPIRYKMIYVGQAEFGRSWAGETLPPKKSVIAWMIAAMKRQGYLLADEQHPPEQLFVFGWGMLQGGEGRPALGFLGGGKVNLMWENETQYGGFVNPNVLRRGMIRMGIAGKVWDIAESDLFMGVVRSYTLDSETAPKPTKLWETRFACPATGLGFDDAMPLLISAAALNFGRETEKPVTLNATDTFGGQVNFGEFKVLGEADKLPDK